MKKQAHYTPDTPIKASAQAAGYLREDFRDFDHEESWILLLNGAHLPLAKKMITVGTIKSTQIDHRRIIKEALLCNATAIILFHLCRIRHKWNYTDCLVIPNNSVMRLYSAFSKSGLG